MQVLYKQLEDLRRDVQQREEAQKQNDNMQLETIQKIKVIFEQVEETNNESSDSDIVCQVSKKNNE